MMRALSLMLCATLAACGANGARARAARPRAEDTPQEPDIGVEQPECSQDIQCDDGVTPRSL